MFILPKNPCFINQIELNFPGNRYNAASFVKNNSNHRHGWLAIVPQMERNLYSNSSSRSCRNLCPH